MKTELEDSKKLQLSSGEVMKMREVSGVQLERECYYNVTVQVCHTGQSGISGGIAIIVWAYQTTYVITTYMQWGTARYSNMGLQKKQAWRQDLDVEYML